MSASSRSHQVATGNPPRPFESCAPETGPTTRFDTSRVLPAAGERRDGSQLAGREASVVIRTTALLALETTGGAGASRRSRALSESKRAIALSSPTLRRAWPRDGPEAAMCVQGVDVQCVLQFTLIHAASCALHRRASRVIHCPKLFFVFLLSREWNTQKNKIGKRNRWEKVRGPARLPACPAGRACGSKVPPILPDRSAFPPSPSRRRAAGRRGGGELNRHPARRRATKDRPTYTRGGARSPPPHPRLRACGRQRGGPESALTSYPGRTPERKGGAAGHEWL